MFSKRSILNISKIIFYSFWGGSLIFNMSTFEAYLSVIQIDFPECLACQHIEILSLWSKHFHGRAPNVWICLKTRPVRPTLASLLEYESSECPVAAELTVNHFQSFEGKYSHRGRSWANVLTWSIKRKTVRNIHRWKSKNIATDISKNTDST